jgi:F-type H+-transporting ATPase subunit b
MICIIMGELLHNFGVDWRLLIAQAINFLVVFMVLKRFAYKPIIAMLRKRREEIERGLQAAKEAEARLAQVGKLKEAAAREAREKALSVVSEAQDLAEKRKEEIAQEAALKGELLLAEAKRAIERERARAGEEIYAEARGLIRMGVTRVLGKMPPEERDETLIKEALQELKAVE